MNTDISHAWEYHNLTKHSWESVRRSGHALDWSNHPRPFKIYPDLEPLALPREFASTPAPAPFDLSQLARLLYFTGGITKTRQYPGGEIQFRAAASTGALYEIELYVVCGPLEDLAAGVYHFSPAEMALRPLRRGDFRGLLGVATPLLVVSTGTYWRNAWKYQARTYRHFGWDNGTMLANLHAMAAAQGWPAHLECGFVDADLNGLLGMDTEREVALTMVRLGQPDSSPPPPPELPRLSPETIPTIPYSRREVDYPEMRAMHQASSLASAEEVAAWGAPAQPRAPGPLPGGASIEEVILRRGSARRFARQPITQAELAAILDCASGGLAADFPGFIELYPIVHAVEGLDSGAYYYRGPGQSLELLKPGDFRRQAAWLGLEQDLPGDAAVAVFLLADLGRCLDRLGNRGYRAVHLEAGLLGGRMYLAAYAQDLGATGLTFYDDEVVEFFSPHARGKSAIFLMAFGHPARRET